MRQKLLRRSPTANIHAKTHAEKRLEFLAQLLGLLETRRAIGGNEIQSLERLLVEIWRFRLDHFDCHNPQ